LIALGSGRKGREWWFSLARRTFLSLCFWETDFRTHQEVLHRISQIFEEVPAVAHLDGQRRALCGPIDIGASAIPAHDLDFWVYFKPGNHRFCRPIFQEINDLVGL
jgi:hypothetical protein